MPEKIERLERKLKMQAKKKGVRDPGAYVYGTLRKLGWRPSREKRRMRGG